mgnify:CR=1 FL=1
MKQGLKEFGRVLLAIIVIVWAIAIVVRIGNKVYKSVKKNNVTQQKFDTKSFKDSKRFKDIIKKLKKEGKIKDKNYELMKPINPHKWNENYRKIIVFSILLLVADATSTKIL